MRKAVIGNGDEVLGFVDVEKSVRSYIKSNTHKEQKNEPK